MILNNILIFLSFALGCFIIYYIFSNSKTLNNISYSKRLLIFFLRLITIILILAAIFDFKITKLSKSNNYIVLIDSSWSMKNNLSKAVVSVNNILEKLLNDNNNSKVQYISFAKEAFIEKINITKNNLIIRKPRTKHDETETNIENALMLALSLTYDNFNNKIIILTDGISTVGNVENVTNRLKLANVSVYPYLFEPILNNNFDIIITSLYVPSFNIINNSFTGNVVVELKNIDKLENCNLQIYRENTLIYHKSVNLFKGLNSFLFTDVLNKSGYVRYTAFIEHPLDKVIQNNTMHAFSLIKGSPQILLVSNKDKSTFIYEVIRKLGYDITNIEPYEFNFNIEKMLNYKLIILNDISVNEIKTQTVITLKDYVSNFGGGVLILGGDNSYGNGGYMMTPLEEIAPVTMDVKNKSKLLSSAIIYVIDKSGSMAEMSTNFEKDRMLKIDLAKEAIIASIKTLLSKDYVGVIAFDSAYKWVFKPTNALNINPLIDEVAKIVAGGGTSMYGALDEAINEIIKLNSSLKHIIVLTDGITSNADFDLLAKKMVENKITFTAIGLGRDADVVFLSTLAQKCNGNFYFCEDAASLPALFLQETLKTTRNLIVEETFVPKIVNTIPLLKMLTNNEISNLPKLHGYIATTLKPNATLYLSSHDDDPILAEIRYGLGKVICFTSDLYSRWSADFIKWNYFTEIIDNIIKALISQNEILNVEWTLKENANNLNVIFKSYDLLGKNINFLNSNLICYKPDNNVETCEIFQIGSGTYCFNVDTKIPGNYIFSLSQTNKYGETFNNIYWYLKPYSNEYTNYDTSSIDILKQLSIKTLGNVIDDKNFFKIINDTSNTLKIQKYSIYDLLIKIVIILFLIEITLWRVDFSSEMYNKIKTFIVNLSFFGTKHKSNSTFENLLKVKKAVLKSKLNNNNLSQTNNNLIEDSNKNIFENKKGSDLHHNSNIPDDKSEPQDFTKKLLKIKKPK